MALMLILRVSSNLAVGFTHISLNMTLRWFCRSWDLSVSIDFSSMLPSTCTKKQTFSNFISATSRLVAKAQLSGRGFGLHGFFLDLPSTLWPLTGLPTVL